MRVYVNTDGGAWPTNPGHGAYGVVLRDDPAGPIVEADKKYLGERVSNNEAEWLGVLRGLELALDRLLRLRREGGATPEQAAAAMAAEDEVDLVADSLLVVKQLLGEYNITKPKFHAWRAQFWQKAGRVHAVDVEHVPREQNTDADGLVRSIREGMVGAVGQARPLDGRRLLYEECRRYFGTRAPEGRYPWLAGDGFVVRPLTFWARQDGGLLPSCERKVWDEIVSKNKEVPVLVAYRPYGNRPVPLARREFGDPTRRHRPVRDDADRGIELLVQFADNLEAEEVPPVERVNRDTGETEMVQYYGYRGSKILQLRGTWIAARDLRGLLSDKTDNTSRP